MQKDDDYFRTLLLELEASEDWIHYIHGDNDGDDPEADKTYYHALLLADAGALAVSGKHMNQFRITDQGYTLIGVMKNDTAWGRVKDVSAAAGKGGAKILMDIAQAYVETKIRTAFGIET